MVRMIPPDTEPRPVIPVVFAADEFATAAYPWAEAPVKIGIEQVLSLAGVQVSFVGNRQEIDDSITGLTASAWNDSREQVEVSAVVGRLPLQKGTKLAILTGLDIYGEGTNFIFGVTYGDEQRGLTLISAHRFASLNSRNRQSVIQHIAKHEFGHLIGLDSRGIVSQDKRNGIYSGHCMNPCVMRQANSLPEAQAQVNELRGAPNHGFCRDCTRVASVLIKQAHTD